MEPARPVTAEADPTSDRAPSGNLRGRLIVFGLIVAVLIALGFLLPVGSYLETFLAWVEGLGWWARVVVVLAYIVSCVLFIPGSAITLGAGALFGVVEGCIVVSIGSTLGACAAFLVGRFVMRDAIARRLGAYPKFAAVDRAVASKGGRIVFLTRLSPIFPFNLLNYAFGLTGVRFGPYALASWIGMMPGTVMYVYLGAAIRVATDEKTLGEKILFVVGLVVTVGVATLVTLIARKALAEATGDSAKETADDA